MVKFLIQRPIAVLLSFLGVLVFSVLALFELPISLLPEIEVPSIIIKVNYPNTPPSIIENSVLKPIRNELNSLDRLADIESTASSETGLIKLQFDYGTRMDLAYIEINEKIDRLQSILPREMDRPQVVRVNTSDIPIIRIQVTPKAASNFLEISELTEKVLKKRIEQLPGVSIVDINGTRKQFISIRPDIDQLKALGLSERELEVVLKSANQELGQLSIKDGQYRYFVRMANRLDDLEEIKALPVVSKEGQVIPLHRLADVSYQTEKLTGFHTYNNKEGLVITVHKQASAKMNELMPLVYDAVNYFKTDYPEADFNTTQDQSLLLNAGISNLKTSLMYGGIFAFFVLFLFMGNYKLPIIMGITLPVSLTISFLLFYAFGLSINIISLSGLALGLGMLIDNSIIVIDNITRKRKEGNDLISSCVSGVNEVMAPLISSVLTTLAVFVPLVFLNGLSGSLFRDQALSVGIILGVSLLVAFILLPLIYRLFFQNQKGSIKQDSLLFKLILSGYKSIFNLIFRFKAISFVLLLTFIPSAYWIINSMEKQGLPSIEKTESQILINWNEPVEAVTNKQRITGFVSLLSASSISESDIGIQQFLLTGTGSTIEQSQVYIKHNSQSEKEKSETWAREFFKINYPNATVEVKDSPNTFEQIFTTNKAFFSVKWKNFKSNEPLSEEVLATLKSNLNSEGETARNGMGFLFEESITASIDVQALATYGIRESSVKTALSNALDGYLVTDIRRFGEVTPLRITRDNQDFRQQLQRLMVAAPDGTNYPLATFVSFTFGKDNKHITSDRTGLYQALEWDEIESEDIERLKATLPGIAGNLGLAVDFDGTYFENEENLSQLIYILIISVVLLYFILAAQFESLVQPLIVIFTLPLGITGALLVLSFTGSTLNVMSAIGIIVMLGIMVNDAILKIDTINRLKEENRKSKNTNSKKEALTIAITKTGEIRLKPILMTSITTILALLPVVFSSGLGADLQRPLVYAVIGGLTIGTFTAIYFVPLAYWFLSSKKGSF